NAFPPIGDLPYFLTLAAHGFFWMLLSDSAPPPSWHVERLPATELPVLVLSQELATFLPEQLGGPSASSVARRTRQQLEQEVLPEFLRPRSWFARHDGALGTARLGPASLWRNEHRTFLLSFVEAEIAARVGAISCRSRWPGKTVKTAARCARLNGRSRRCASMRASAC